MLTPALVGLLWIGAVGAAASPPPAPTPLGIAELFPSDDTLVAWAREGQDLAPLQRILDALAPLGSDPPLAGADLLSVDFEAASSRADPSGQLLAGDPLLVQALAWSHASSWSLYPAPLSVDPRVDSGSLVEGLRLLVRSLLRQGRDRGDVDRSRAALRLLRLFLDAALLPEDELAALALLDELLVAVEEEARLRGDLMSAATTYAAAESVMRRRTNLLGSAWLVSRIAVRVRAGLFGPKLIDWDRNRVRGFAHQISLEREQERSRSSRAELLRGLWIVSRTARFQTAELATELLRSQRRDEDPALAALAAWWLEQPWKGGALAGDASFLAVDRIDSVTAWAHGAGWREGGRPMEAELISSTVLGSEAGDLGAWLRSFVFEHRSRFPELGIEIREASVPYIGRVEPLPPEHPLLAEAAREVERGSCRLSRGQLGPMEGTRLHLLLRTLVRSWGERARAALEDGDLVAAGADLLRARRLLRLAAADPSINGASSSATSRALTGAAEPLLRLEARLALASGDSEAFLSSYRAWRVSRVMRLQSRQLHQVLAVRWDLRHGSPVEAFIKRPRVSEARLDWIIALTAADFEHGQRHAAARSLWLLAHEGSASQRERCTERLQELTEDSDETLAERVRTWVGRSPTDSDVPGFEWDTFGESLLERSLLPESWWR